MQLQHHSEPLRRNRCKQGLRNQSPPAHAAARLRGTRIDVTQILQKEPKIQLDKGQSCSSPRCFREVGLSVMRVIFRMQAKESTWVSMNAPREHLGCRTCVNSCYFIIRKVNANWVRASPKQSSAPPILHFNFRLTPVKIGKSSPQGFFWHVAEINL